MYPSGVTNLFLSVAEAFGKVRFSSEVVSIETTSSVFIIILELLGLQHIVRKHYHELAFFFLHLAIIASPTK